MKFMLIVLLALLLLCFESVIVKYLGFSVTRIDVTVALVAFLALRAPSLSGALSACAIGYLLDVMSGYPTCLYMFLAVFLFLLGRVTASVVDVRSALGFGLYVMGADATHGVLQVFFNWLVSPQGGTGTLSVLPALPLQILITGLAGVLLYPLLNRIESGTNQRPKTEAFL